MSSINPGSSQPRPPRPRRPDEQVNGQGGMLEGRPGRGPDGQGPELARDAFHRSHRPHPHHGPHGPREGGRERPTPPDPATMAARLLQADANGDGMLTRDELTAYFEQRLAERVIPPSDEASAQPTAVATEPAVAPVATSVSDVLATGLTDEELAGLTPSEDPAADLSSPTEGPNSALTTVPTVEGTAEAPSEDASAPADPASLQQQVLAWLASIQQDPQFASLSTDQQQQLQEATQAVTALDPADPAFSDSLQTLLQSYGLAE